MFEPNFSLSLLRLVSKTAEYGRLIVAAITAAACVIPSLDVCAGDIENVVVIVSDDLKAAYSVATEIRDARPLTSIALQKEGWYLNELIAKALCVDLPGDLSCVAVTEIPKV